MQYEKYASLTTACPDKSGQGRTKLLSIVINRIPQQCGWLHQTAATANAYLNNSAFERLGELDIGRLKAKISYLEARRDYMRVYSGLLDVLKSKTGLDPMASRVVRQNPNSFAQQNFVRAFGVLALAWTLISREMVEVQKALET